MEIKITHLRWDKNIMLLKKFIILFSFGFILLGANFVFAEEILSLDTVDIHLKIISGENSFYDADISVSACDSDNIPDTVDIVTPYCAILQSGVSSNWDWSWAPGAFVTSIGDISGYTSQDKDGNDVYHYWSWSLNDSEAMTGLNQYELQSGDSILLEFIDPPVEIEEEIIEEPVHSSHSGSSGSYIIIPEKKIFSVPRALEFLSLNQKDNGSFGDVLYTDWVAIGIAGVEDEANTIKNKLYDYLKNYEFQSQIVTDNERHAMALMSLGINPYIGTKIDYIKKITDTFDGTQIGDLSLFNDDIFALIILNKVGYTKNDKIISKIVSYIISKQSQDGSWGSVDMTAVAIQALKNFRELDNVEEAIKNSELYLLSKQMEDGSFGNSFSTSWAIQALKEKGSFNLEINKAIEYLSSEQQEDGGLEKESGNESRIWATAYAIPATQLLSWNDILKSFEKKAEIINEKKENVNNISVPVISKKEINKEKNDPPNNLLVASVADSIENENIHNESVFKKLNKIKLPLWLFWINWIF